MSDPNTSPTPLTPEQELATVPRILVVDDTEDNLDLLEFAMRKKPVDMFRATSGMECLEIAEKRLPDMILLDIQMPEMDGFETLRRLKANPVTKHIPVIFLTAARRDAKSVEQGILLGAEDYLMKPIDIDELLARVRSIARLVAVQRELETMRERFFAMLVHDLRSPLAGITDAIEFVLRSVEQGSPVEKIHLDLMNASLGSARSMLGLVNDLLDLSKYQSGRVPLDLERTSVPAVVEQALLAMSSRFDKKGIRVNVEKDDEIPDALVDPRKLSQVMNNLLSNAFKFTPANGTVTIRMAVQESGPGGSRSLRINVVDTGIGVSAEELPNLFQYYRQAASAKMVKHKGTGLGLVICKLIVEAHKGTIGMESEVGKGTTCTIVLPLDAAPHRAAVE